MTPAGRQQPTVAQRDLIRLGRIAEHNFGLTVGENPWFGGVTPVHTEGSYHYKGLAIDVSGPADKMSAFRDYVARRYGPVVAELFHEPGVNLKDGARTTPIGGHDDHVHVALDPSLLRGHQGQYFGSARPGKSLLEQMSPAERKRFEEIAEHENLGTSFGDVVPGGHTIEDVAGDAGNAVVDGIAGLFADHAEGFMLNVGLIGGGAFLVYYGAALMLGIKAPAKPIVETAAKVAVVAPK